MVTFIRQRSFAIDLGGEIMRHIMAWSVLVLALVVGACSLHKNPSPTALYEVNADGSHLRVLLASSGQGYWGPALSPDGTRLVFTFGVPNGELYLTNPDGSGMRPLTHNGRTNYLPAWSPDGRTISFVSQNGSEKNTAEIYTIELDGSHETRLTNNNAWEYGSSWSRDGTRIVFGSQRGGQWRIYTMRPDGTDQAPLASPSQGNAPAWSPNGMEIAFTSDRDGDDDIWIMNSHGSDQRNLTNNTAWDDNPQWSPDGSRIAFTSDRDGNPNLFIMNADGTAPRNVTRAVSLETGIASWSPTGNLLVFHAAPTGK